MIDPLYAKLLINKIRIKTLYLTFKDYTKEKKKIDSLREALVIFTLLQPMKIGMGLTLLVGLN